MDDYSYMQDLNVFPGCAQLDMTMGHIEEYQPSFLNLPVPEPKHMISYETPQTILPNDHHNYQGNAQLVPIQLGEQNPVIPRELENNDDGVQPEAEADAYLIDPEPESEPKAEAVAVAVAVAVVAEPLFGGPNDVLQGGTGQAMNDGTNAADKEGKERRRRGRPRLMDDFRPSWLPAHWYVTKRTRLRGASAGHVDKYYINPEGETFRSKREVQNYVHVEKVVRGCNHVKQQAGGDGVGPKP